MTADDLYAANQWDKPYSYRLRPWQLRGLARPATQARERPEPNRRSRRAYFQALFRKARHAARRKMREATHGT